MNTIINTFVALAICGVVFANPTNETERIQLMQRIHEGNPAAMLEAGNSGDPTMIPTLDGFLQARSNAVAQEMNRWTEALERKVQFEEERRRMMPRREFFMGPEYDEAAQNARTALAKFGVKEYADGILTELRDPRRSMVVRVRYPTLSPHDIYRVQVKALGKLGYIEDPTVVKFVGPYLYQTSDPFPLPPDAPTGAIDAVAPRPRPLAEHAVSALRKIVKDGPDTDDVKAWQQWWEQNKDKYP